MALVKNSNLITKKNRETGEVVVSRRFESLNKTEMEIIKDNFDMNHVMAKRLLAKRYDNKCVITKVSVNSKGNVTKIYKGTTSNCPMIDITKPDANFYDTVRIENANNGDFYETEIHGVEGFYKYYPDIVQVTFRSNADQLEMTRQGAYFKLGEKVRYSAPKDSEGWIHVPGASVWGPSNEKAANKFFFSDRLSNEEWWNLIDGLTGSAYGYFFKHEQKAAKILKNTSRLNMFGTTMEKFAEIDLTKYRVAIASCNFDAVDDMDEETRDMLKNVYGLDFDVCINDGKDYILADFLAETLGITPEQACLLAPQNRANYVQTKCLAQNLLKDQMEHLLDNLMYLYPGEIKVYGNPNGPVALIADDNAAKLVNVEALEAGNITIDVYALAIAKASNSRTSGQLIAKLLEKNYKLAIEKLSKLTKEAFHDLFIGKIDQSSVKFNPHAGINNNTGAVLGELAVNDEGFMWSTLHDMTTFAKSALADMKIALDSVYNHAMFDDCYVMSKGMVDHILTVKDCGKYGKLVEVFSLDVIRYFMDVIQEIEEDKSLTDAEKEEALDELLSAYVIKYPSAGAEEFLGVRFLTLKEWRQRVAKAITKMENKGASETDIDFFKQYCNQIPFGVTVFAGFNFIKNKLAGMDVDFDATLSVFDDTKEILLGRDEELDKALENILTFIDYEDNSKADYEAETPVKLRTADLNFGGK